MSDAVEDLYLRLGDTECEEWEAYESRNTVKYSFMDNRDYWVTKDGVKIHPRQMSTDHLRNTIRHIENTCSKGNLVPENYKIYNMLVEEIIKRYE